MVLMHVAWKKWSISHSIMAQKKVKKTYLDSPICSGDVSAKILWIKKS